MSMVVERDSACLHFNLLHLVTFLPGEDTPDGTLDESTREIE